VRYYLVTGSSRGLGEGIVRALLGQDATVFTLARTNNSEMEKIADKSGGRLAPFNFDLAETTAIDGLLDEIFSEIDFEEASGLYLINNAGVLPPMGPVETNDATQTEYHIRVNLLAPMRLTSGFIARSSGCFCRKVVANVSSGAARHPYFGWSSYCAGKAGLNMFTQVVGVEQRELENPVIIFSIDPGIVDTDMQAEIRAVEDSRFRDKSTFIRYREMGYLADPLETGRKIAAALDDPTIATGDTVSVKKG